MTDLVTSLKRIWSAAVPGFTGSKNSGSRKTPNDETAVACGVHQWMLALLGIVRRTTPSAVVIACSLFR